MNVEFRAMYGPTDWGWINDHVGILRVEDTRGIVAVDSSTQELLAAAVFDNWTHTTVQVHLVVARPMVLKHGFLEECHDFVFNVCEKRAAYGMIPANNTKAIKLNEHMGYTEVYRMPEGFAKGVDYVVMELKKENAKYLPALPEAKQYG